MRPGYLSSRGGERFAGQDHLPHLGPARQDRGVWREGAGRRPSQVPQLAGDGDLQQARPALRFPAGRRVDAQGARGDRRRGLHGRADAVSGRHRERRGHPRYRDHGRSSADAQRLRGQDLRSLRPGRGGGEGHRESRCDRRGVEVGPSRSAASAGSGRLVARAPVRGVRAAPGCRVADPGVRHTAHRSASARQPTRRNGPASFRRCRT